MDSETKYSGDEPINNIGDEPTQKPDAVVNGQDPSSPSGTQAGTETEAKEPAAADLAVLEAKLAEAVSAAEENREQFLRARAELENFRRRTRQEKEELARYASEKVLLGLLPVLDSLDRAVLAAKETTDVEALQKGLEAINRQFWDVLSREGLKPVESVGQRFDPQFHEAVAQQESAEYDDLVVVEEYRKGYLLHDRVIRPAMVSVNRNPNQQQ